AARKNVDQLHDLTPLLTLVAGRDRMLDAVCDVVGKDFLLRAAQRRPRRRKLGHDVDAIAVVLDHARQPAHLPLDALEASEHRRLGIRLHDGYIPLPGIYFKQGFAPWIRRFISTAQPPSIRFAA